MVTIKVTIGVTIGVTLELEPKVAVAKVALNANGRATITGKKMRRKRSLKKKKKTIATTDSTDPSIIMEVERSQARLQEYRNSAQLVPVGRYQPREPEAPRSVHHSEEHRPREPIQELEVRLRVLLGTSHPELQVPVATDPDNNLDPVGTPALGPPRSPVGVKDTEVRALDSLVPVHNLPEAGTLVLALVLVAQAWLISPEDGIKDQKQVLDAAASLARAVKVRVLWAL